MKNLHLILAWIVLAVISYWAVSSCGTVNLARKASLETFSEQEINELGKHDNIFVPPPQSQRQSCDTMCTNKSAVYKLSKNDPWRRYFPGGEVDVCAERGKDGKAVRDRYGQPIQIRQASKTSYDTCDQCGNCGKLKSNGIDGGFCVPLHEGGILAGTNNNRALGDSNIWYPNDPNGLYISNCEAN